MEKKETLATGELCVEARLLSVRAHIGRQEGLWVGDRSETLVLTYRLNSSSAYPTFFRFLWVFLSPQHGTQLSSWGTSIWTRTVKPGRAWLRWPPWSEPKGISVVWVLWFCLSFKCSDARVSVNECMGHQNTLGRRSMINIVDVTWFRHCVLDTNLKRGKTVNKLVPASELDLLLGEEGEKTWQIQKSS